MRSIYSLAFHCLFLLLVCASHAQDQRWTTQKIDNISFRLPADFINMSEGERIEKYVSSRLPLAVYTSSTRDADLGINRNNMQWKAEDTQIVYGFYKASIQSLFDDIQFLQDTTRTINGRTFIVFEFVSTLRDDNIFSTTKTEKHYTYIQYTSYQDQVLLFNFGCPARFRNRWEQTARTIMESVKIN